MVNIKQYKDKNGKPLSDKEYAYQLISSERFRRLRIKVFSIPFLTMFGIWILVYYQVTSHYHYFRYGWNTYQVGRDGLHGTPKY